MTAFFHSDLRTAASLTYPETLQQIKNAFMQERAAAVAAGREPGFLSNSGITDPANLDALGLADFYAAVVSGSRRSQPDFVTAMKVAVVAVKSSERTDSEHAIVTLAITVPTGAGTHTQDTRLSLVFVDGQWKVVGNVK